MLRSQITRIEHDHIDLLFAPGKETGCNQMRNLETRGGEVNTRMSRSPPLATGSARGIISISRGRLKADRWAQSARPRGMSLANSLREAKGGACPPFLSRYVNFTMAGNRLLPPSGWVPKICRGLPHCGVTRSRLVPVGEHHFRKSGRFPKIRGGRGGQAWPSRGGVCHRGRRILPPNRG